MYGAQFLQLPVDDTITHKISVTKAARCWMTFRRSLSSPYAVVLSDGIGSARIDSATIHRGGITIMGDEYSGILDWEDQPKCHLVVHFLRLLPSKALFDFTSVSPEGHWRVQGSAAMRDGQEFQSESLTAFQSDQKSDPLRITFEKLRLSDDGSICEVRGQWNDATGTGVFLGDLDRK